MTHPQPAGVIVLYRADPAAYRSVPHRETPPNLGRGRSAWRCQKETEVGSDPQLIATDVDRGAVTQKRENPRMELPQIHASQLGPIPLDDDMVAVMM